MDDLISRQAAIDALVKWTHLTWEHLKIIYPMLNVLEKLPSAETELPFEIQDILDYLDTVLHPIISPEYWNVYSELYDMISTLPPAERRGRWIETGMLYRDTRGINSLFYGKRCSVCNEISDYKPHYCPNCGARMEAE